MRRLVGALLVGLGAVVAVVAIGLPLYVAPSVTKLPYKMVLCPSAPAAQPAGCLKPSVLEAKQAQFLQIQTVNGDLVIKVNTADLRGTTEVSPQAQKTADEQAAGRLSTDAVVWDVFTSAVRLDNNAVVGGSSTELAIDRVSGACVDWSGQWISEFKDSKDTSIVYSEQLYKFPFGTEKRDYKYYDTDLRQALPIKFTSVEEVSGIETYRFVQQIPDSMLNVSPGNISALLGKLAPAATSGTIYYRNTREVWVDPVTGALVKVREQQFKELRPNTGPAVTLLKADFVTTQDTIANTAAAAKDNAFLLSLVWLYGPIGAGVLALALIIVGLLLARRREEPAGGSFSDDLPESRHGLRAEPTNA